jgi:tRNA-2-methylthio-N6-dimethylallyladenosine synthase
MSTANVSETEMKYYLWTIGCQMNRAESSEIEDRLKSIGFAVTAKASDADLVILNTCVVRQNAEDKAEGMLGYLKGIKSGKPGMTIAVTGCIVDSEVAALHEKYPHVDRFFKAGDFKGIADWLESEALSRESVRARAAAEGTVPVTAYVPIIQGCNNYCSYCVVPFRRGPERSRPLRDIVDHAAKLACRGAKEVVLLGQNVNAYGKDLADGSTLASLLRRLDELPGLVRIRFLTNHPKDMSPDLIAAMVSLDKVCKHVCLPLQSGDDLILRAMNRHYTVEEYKSLIGRLRGAIPGIAVSTDIIVGFPGETEQQFLNTYDCLEELHYDMVHVAAYSPRPGTQATANLVDDVSAETKARRLHAIEDLQTKMLAEANQQFVGEQTEVLVEGRKGGKWYGRTTSDKLVFFSDERDRAGDLAVVLVTSATAWALRGTVIL